MPGLAELLGQREMAERVLVDLLDRGASCVRITGPAGSGKSEVARGVASAWLDGGGACLIAIGDDERSGRPLYPLLAALAGANRMWVEFAGKGTRGALEVASKVVPAGKIATSFWDLLQAAARQRAERVLKPYSTAERDVIVDLKRLARSKRLLIVADNAHWWDREALRLLDDALSPRLQEAVPQLANAAVLMVDTADEQPVIAPEAFALLSARSKPFTRRTARCTRPEFADVLHALGVSDPLPPDVLDALYGATNGHLKLAEQVAAYARRDGFRALVADREGDYAASLVAARVDSLGASSPEVRELLTRAAVLGLSFTEQDLKCITGGGPVRALLDRAELIGFVGRDKDQIAFSHDVIRAGILSDQTPSQRRELYARLSECLATLRPADFAARAQASAQAGEEARTSELLALDGVARMRGGVPTSRVLAEAAADRLAYLELMAAASDAVAAGDFAGGSRRLRVAPAAETVLMAAERHYLSALCALEAQTRSGVNDALTLLGAWLATVADEPDLRTRFLLLQQQAQVLAEDFDAARATETKLESELVTRAGYDPAAAVTLQIQNRRAAAIDVPEIAALRIAEAVTFFRRPSGDRTRHRLETFRALTNLAAVQLRLGQDAQAQASAREAEQIALEDPEAVRRIDVAASNLVLARLRSGSIDAAQAAERQRLIIASPEGSDDKFIHRCNLAAYLLLAGRDGEAVGELNALEEELRTLDFDETYLVFYSRALGVGAAALAGDVEAARARHAALDTFVAGLRWPCAAYVRRRHALLPDWFSELKPELPRAAADRVLLDARPREIGPAWPYYGRLLPCAELSYWSDS